MHIKSYYGFFLRWIVIRACFTSRVLNRFFIVDIVGVGGSVIIVTQGDLLNQGNSREEKFKNSLLASYVLRSQTDDCNWLKNSHYYLTLLKNHIVASLYFKIHSATPDSFLNSSNVGKLMLLLYKVKN